MKLNLRDVLASDDQRISFDYSIDLSQEEINFEFPFQQPVRVTGSLENKADVFWLNAKVETMVSTVCARCAKPMEYEKNLEISLVIAQNDNGDVSDDTYIVDSDTFELDEIIHEELILSMEMAVLCKPDCKGLCPKCGHDLNEGDCGCNRKEIDPRLAKLQELLQDK
ncbi:YceD family protein [Acidaminobacterium chupaoyuni]